MSSIKNFSWSEFELSKESTVMGVATSRLATCLSMKVLFTFIALGFLYFLPTFLSVPDLTSTFGFSDWFSKTSRGRSRISV